jgi:hypothetical protein
MRVLLRIRPAGRPLGNLTRRYRRAGAALAGQRSTPRERGASFAQSTTGGPHRTSADGWVWPSILRYALPCVTGSSRRRRLVASRVFRKRDGPPGWRSAHEVDRDSGLGTSPRTAGAAPQDVVRARRCQANGSAASHCTNCARSPGSSALPSTCALSRAAASGEKFSRLFVFAWWPTISSPSSRRTGIRAMTLASAAALRSALTAHIRR